MHCRSCRRSPSSGSSIWAWLSPGFPISAAASHTVSYCAAAPVSQMFMLVGTLILLPIILGYTGLIYWLFRGKVAEGESYH